MKSALRRDTENNWLMRVNNIIRLTESILSYYENYTKMKVQVDVDAAAVGRNGDVNEICKLLTLTINLLMTCDDAQQYVTVLLTQLSVDAQNDIKCAIEAVSFYLLLFGLFLLDGRKNEIFFCCYSWVWLMTQDQTKAPLLLVVLHHRRHHRHRRRHH